MRQEEIEELKATIRGDVESEVETEIERDSRLDKIMFEYGTPEIDIGM